MFNLISLVVGSGGNKGMRRRREFCCGSSSGRTPVVFDSCSANTHMQYVHYYSPATAFAIEWHGLTRHHSEPVFDVS